LVQKLRERGYQNAWALRGGYDAWKAAGLPLEQKSKAA
jgi:rhodanese-related sulfurtransferase